VGADFQKYIELQDRMEEINAKNSWKAV
jgi:hypothetical protein